MTMSGSPAPGEVEAYVKEFLAKRAAVDAAKAKEKTEESAGPPRRHGKYIWPMTPERQQRNAEVRAAMVLNDARIQREWDEKQAVEREVAARAVAAQKITDKQKEVLDRWWKQVETTAMPHINRAKENWQEYARKVSEAAYKEAAKNPPPGFSIAQPKTPGDIALAEALRAWSDAEANTHARQTFEKEKGVNDAAMLKSALMPPFTGTVRRPAEYAELVKQREAIREKTTGFTRKPMEPTVIFTPTATEKKEAKIADVSAYGETATGEMIPMPSKLALAKVAAKTLPLTVTAPSLLPSFLMKETQPDIMRRVVSGERSAAMVDETNVAQARQWGLVAFKVPHGNFTGKAAENNAYIVYSPGSADKAKEVVAVLQKYPIGKRAASYYIEMGRALGVPPQEVNEYVNAYYGNEKGKTPTWLGVLGFAAIAILIAMNLPKQEMS